MAWSLSCSRVPVILMLYDLGGVKVNCCLVSLPKCKCHKKQFSYLRITVSGGGQVQQLEDQVSCDFSCQVTLFKSLPKLSDRHGVVATHTTTPNFEKALTPI